MAIRIKNRFISLMQFSRENTYVTIKHTKKCRNSPIIKKSKLKTTFHITREIVLMRLPSAGELTVKRYDQRSPLQTGQASRSRGCTDRTVHGQDSLRTGPRHHARAHRAKRLTTSPAIPFLGFNLRRRIQNIQGGKLYIQSFITELHRIKNKKQPKCAKYENE